MTREFVPPTLSDLLARYLHRQVSAHGEGLGMTDPSADVVPHEAVPVQPIEPRLAWNEAQAALRLLGPGAETGSAKAPPDWPALVAAHEPETALALCAGNFPQLVRDLLPLLQADDLASLRRPSGPPAAVPALLDAADRKPTYPQRLLIAGSLRLARHFDRAAELLDTPEENVPAEWRAAWANERAALAWHRGHCEEAAALWHALPASVPVLFNRGMAALFLGRSADAHAALAQAVQQVPEASAWHHLGRLYLALAEMRRKSART